MRVIECEQGTPEWIQARAGKITASRIVDVMAYLQRGGEKQARADYRIELMTERLTGAVDDYTFKTGWLRDGKDKEPFARASYELQTERYLHQVGFVLHPTMDFAGASPDGLFETLGGVEIKCPKSTTHVRWIIEGGVPPEHQPQMLWNMECCELEWMDFYSYDERILDESMQGYLVRMNRDDERIKTIREEVIRFEEEVCDALEKAKARCRNGL